MTAGVRAHRARLAAAQGVVRWACRRLPDGVREQREQEWLAELPAILADPEIGLAWVRAGKALLFAFGAARAVRCMGRRAKHGRIRASSRALVLVLAAVLVVSVRTVRPSEKIGMLDKAKLAVNAYRLIRTLRSLKDRPRGVQVAVVANLLAVLRAKDLWQRGAWQDPARRNA